MVLLAGISLIFGISGLAGEGGDVSVRAGAKLFERECAGCHVRHRVRNTPRLDTKEVAGLAPEALFRVLRDGSARRGMPSFAHLPEAQRWQIITFLKDGGAW